MRILIIGGSGFVGSYLLNFLKRHYFVEVTYFSGNKTGIKYNAETDVLSDIIKDKFDVVINNINPENLSFTGVSKNIESVIDYCKANSAKMIQISSVSASKSNRNTNSYTLKKAISEDIIMSEMSENSFAILRFTGLFDYKGLSRKTQGGLYYIVESIKKEHPLTLLLNHEECLRNFMPIELLVQIVHKTITQNIKGIHNAYFNSFTLSFLDLITIFDSFNVNDYSSPVELGTYSGISYVIDKESDEIHKLIAHKEVQYYLNKFFKSINVN